MSQRKKYSKEFKIDAINLVQEQGYSCSEAAKSLDIPYDLLNRWIRESKKSDKNEAFRGNGKLSAEQLGMGLKIEGFINTFPNHPIK